MDFTWLLLVLALWDKLPAPPSLSPEDLEVVRNLELLRDLELATELEMFAGPPGEAASASDPAADDTLPMLPEEVSP